MAVQCPGEYDGPPDGGGSVGDDGALKAEIGERVRQAVRLAGGNKAVSAKSGIPLRTLANLLDGQELKVGQLVRLAAACAVSVDWLATGRLPVHPVDRLAATAAEGRPPVDVDGLEAVLLALDQATAQGGLALSAAKRAKVAALLWDLRQSGAAADHAQLVATAARLVALAG